MRPVRSWGRAVRIQTVAAVLADLGGGGSGSSTVPRRGRWFHRKGDYVRNLERPIVGFRRERSVLVRQLSEPFREAPHDLPTSVEEHDDDDRIITFPVGFRKVDPRK